MMACVVNSLKVKWGLAQGSRRTGGADTSPSGLRLSGRDGFGVGSLGGVPLGWGIRGGGSRGRETRAGLLSWGALVLLAAVAGEGGWVWGQGPAGEKSGRPAAGETRRGERGREESSRVDTKPAGRLPAYYGEVVSKEQRARIYEIQGRIQEQIARLRDQIEALDRQLQSDVEAVLTPEQREQVQKRVAEAKAKRAQRIAERAQAGPSTTE